LRLAGMVGRGQRSDPLKKNTDPHLFGFGSALSQGFPKRGGMWNPRDCVQDTRESHFSKVFVHQRSKELTEVGVPLASVAGGSPSGVSCGVYLEQVKQHLRDALALREFGVAWRQRNWCLGRSPGPGRDEVESFGEVGERLAMTLDGRASRWCTSTARDHPCSMAAAA
jgi:hypothetical protein